MKDQNEKQAIEEMAKVIERTEQIARDAHCGLPSPTMYAKDLYWHGYRRIVRCKDCEYRHDPINCALWYGSCEDNDYFVENGDDFFCSYGKRKGGAE